MPVMEGKAIFYTAFTDLNAVPILIDEKHPDAFVRTVLDIAPSFGAIHLEDIRVPECFEIEKRPDRGARRPRHARRRPRHGGRRARRDHRRVRAARPAARAIRRSARSGSAPPASASPAWPRHARAKAVVATDPDPLAQTHADANGIEIADFETVMARADIVVATTGRPGLIGSEMIREGQVDLRAHEPRPRDPAAGRAARRRRLRRRRRRGQQRPRLPRASSSARSPAARARSRPG